MGSSLFIKSDSAFANKSIPSAFTRSDGKGIAATLEDEDLMNCLERCFQIDLAPLKRIWSEETYPEFWVEEGYTDEEALEIIRQEQVKNETAWQDPDDLANALKALLSSLRRFTPEGDDLVLFDGILEYVIDGTLIPDLTDLLHWTQRMKENGATRVLLEIL